MSSQLMILDARPNLGFALFDGTLFYDPTAGAWKPFDPAFVRPLVRPFAAGPNAAILTGDVPAGLPPLTAIFYTLDVTGAPTAAVDLTFVRGYQPEGVGAVIVNQNFGR